MTARLRHRGPDEEGAFVNGTVALGSRRLKVIDLATGRMPIGNETGTVQVVYNGEIYNYRSLRQELHRRGHVFDTNTDTEVLVHGYEEYGIDIANRLVGMFAFALWDGVRDTLYLVRDRLGIKPLFYTINNGTLLFGSELKALLALAPAPLEPDPTSLVEYLGLGYIRAPRTIYPAYHKLSPGCILRFHRGSVHVRRFWSFPVPGVPWVGTESEAAAALETLLRTAVTDRLVADVPLGAFLSGGIDSSVVVALAAEAVTGRLQTFSVGFEGNHELDYARLVARRFNTDHTELMLGADSCHIVGELLAFFDEPFGDPSVVPTYYVSELARRHVTVALSGDGGDELFAGYDQYANDERWAWTDHLPSALRRLVFGLPTRVLPYGAYGWNLLRSLAASRQERYALYVAQELDPHKGGLLHPRLMQAYRSARDLFAEQFAVVRHMPIPAQLLYVDATSYLPDDILAKVDRMSMAHSLEARVPLLDHRLVEFVTSLPMDLKLRQGERKWIFKRVAERYLPPAILHRSKQGFSLPIGQWLRTSLADYLELLLRPDSRSGAYLHRPTVERLVSEHRRRRRDHADTLWRLIALELWLRRASTAAAEPLHRAS